MWTFQKTNKGFLRHGFEEETKREKQNSTKYQTKITSLEY